jgi:hypothetical protein
LQHATSDTLNVYVCVLLQGTCVGSLDSVEMLFKFIAPLVQEGEDDDDMDEEVRVLVGQAGNFCEAWWGRQATSARPGGAGRQLLRGLVGQAGNFCEAWWGRQATSAAVQCWYLQRCMALCSL